MVIHNGPEDVKDKHGKAVIEEILHSGNRGALHAANMSDRTIRTIRDVGFIPSHWARAVLYICGRLGIACPDSAFRFSNIGEVDYQRIEEALVNAIKPRGKRKAKANQDNVGG